MSNAHKSSMLMTVAQVLAVDFKAFHLDGRHDGTAVCYGDTITPTEYSIGLDVGGMGKGVSFVGDGVIGFTPSTTYINEQTGSIGLWYSSTMFDWDSQSVNDEGSTIEYLFNWADQISLYRDRSLSQIIARYNDGFAIYNYAGQLTGDSMANITFRYSTTTIDLFVNGEMVATAVPTGAIARPTGLFYIGSKADYVMSAYGIINDLIISHDFLSNEEIERWAISGIPLYNPYDGRAWA